MAILRFYSPRGRALVEALNQWKVKTMSNIDRWNFCKTCGTEQMVNTATATIECGSKDHKHHSVLRNRCSAVSHVWVENHTHTSDDCDLSFAETRLELMH